MSTIKHCYIRKISNKSFELAMNLLRLNGVPRIVEWVAHDVGKRVV